ncbi:ribbon-helix-helix protein, CopG family [Candidatus Daviesbacteria bacterium]|nr:ribbon-helix-helix protein, CopG family [Candidatus Daviesbacteria bacterium]
MQTVSLPRDLEKEVEKQVKQGRFGSKSEFMRFAVETYLSLQKGELSWDILATPFRAYAKEKKLSETDILKAVEKGRHGKSSKDR